MRGGRERLTVRRPLIDTALASLDLDPSNIEEARRLGNKLQAAVDRWQVGRNLISAPVRLSKAEADRKLRSMLRSQMIGRAAANV